MTRTDLTIPFGKGQGRGPISQATNEQLRDFIRYQTHQFDTGQVEERYARHNEMQLQQAENELKRREQGGRTNSAPHQSAAAPPPPAAPIARADMMLGAAIHDAKLVSEKLLELSEKCHIIGPFTQVDAIPEGFGVSFSMLAVHPEKDTYSVGAGKFCLNGDVLVRFAATAGVSWDTRESRALDDRSEPYYCHFLAVGWATNIDNTKRVVPGTVEIDYRDGSPAVQEIIASARASDPPKDPDPQIRRARKFILREAESKAQNRAVRALGVKRAYTKEELKKPFVVLRLTFTGQTEDPILRREFALLGANAALSTLYGQLPSGPRVASRRPHAPPEVGDTFEGDGHGDDVDFGIETKGEHVA